MFPLAYAFFILVLCIFCFYCGNTQGSLRTRCSACDFTSRAYIKVYRVLPKDMPVWEPEDISERRVHKGSLNQKTESSAGTQGSKHQAYPEYGLLDVKY